MLIVLIALFAVALVAPLIFRRLGRSGFYVLAAVPAAAFVWLVITFDQYTGEGQNLLEGQPNAPPSIIFQWIPSLALELAFRMDTLAAVLSLLILGIGALVLFYCARYFKQNDPNLGPFGAQLLAFAGAMFGLVTADDMILLFIFWELTTVLSYLLIGYSRHRLAARRAALQALIVTTLGGLTMLVGMIMLGQTAGTYRISDIMAQSESLLSNGLVVDVAIGLILVGAITKSALIPFHFWLPGAMAAPTPVSAYLHAAAMVKAGIYLVARFAPGFSDAASWMPMIMILGLATMLIGGWRALRQHDLKLILAYGTVSQLGFLTMVVGLGGPGGALAGLGMLVAHGLFKATLFLVVGIIDHQAGTRDIRKLAGIRKSAPALAVIATIGAASMAGIPPLLGFVAKESIFETFVHQAEIDPTPVGTLLLVGIVAGSALTFAYSARFVWGGFACKGEDATPFKRVEKSFLFAPAVLTVFTVGLGLWPAPLDAIIQPYVTLFEADGEESYLALWHGFTPALALSAVTIAVGILLFWFRAQVERAQSKVPALIDSERGYKYTIGTLDDVAVWITGRTQRGSLAFYLFVILTMAIITPLTAIVFYDAPLPDRWHYADSPAQVAAGAVILLGILAAVRATKRFMAVLMVGVTGYGMALIFALQGAPDLALTQMLVETIVLVAFVLALRSLPARLWQREPGRYRLLRAVLGISFGLVMAAIAMSAMASRIATPVSLEYPGLAYEGGGGENIVNVTLVDIRAWDTYGEISVLAIAATGIASLIFIRGRGDTRQRAESVKSGSVDRGQEPIAEFGREAAARELAKKFSSVSRDAWLVAGRTLAPERRSIIFEVVTRLLFHSIIIFSIYLLLAGHNLPGGGFAGGLMAGLALTVRYLAGGRFELAEASPVSAGVLLGAGMATTSLSALIPLLMGGQILQTAIIEFWMPVFGDVKFVTSTVFDIGVYLVVVGLVLDVLRSLGSEIDERSEGLSASSDPDSMQSQQQEHTESGEGVVR
ncbi:MULTISPECIES: Na+/H+ antiporter subunit A [unclassified Arthrobacter]|uniref:Na+/H+ antiporter subunit A n=1 Tax=unclassified Arthrobacter TaxID=235627 RepID=UPI001491CBDD|nr:Na+/H+ antiporter subunit A [Arthrobacter sp. AET 35A]MBE0009164.1 Na+/H+ antiporter subunit A [Arthrobacter sp. AET 35A]NOJ63026.1 Na+/H+ antiporter subunit A [Arthrobacter sp. 147(2020)]